jgi:hypothetical protein
MLRRMLVSAVLVGACAAVAWTGSALASTVTVGPPLTGTYQPFQLDDPATFTNTTVEAGAQATSPVKGTIVCWRITDATGGPFSLRVLTSDGGSTYTGAGTSAPEMSTGVTTQSFATNLPIKAGQAIGIDNPNDDFLGIRFDVGTHLFWSTPLLADGSTRAAQTTQPLAGELGFNADVQTSGTNQGCGGGAGGGGPTAAPANTARPKITGTAKSGKKLSCSTGSWTNSPTSFAYGWNRDGTPIPGAAKTPYTVQKLDQGLTLTCSVTASNAIGPSSPATSNGVKVGVPSVHLCPAATGKLDGQTLGLVKLGMTRQQARRKYKHSSNRGKRYEDFFCLTPIGVRVAYGSPKLAGKERKRFENRVIWASTSSAFYALRGVRASATVKAAGKKLKLTGPFHIGLNTWYLAPNGSSTGVLKTRHGIVEEIGIGQKVLTNTHKAQVAFLHSFS